jgi:hypothetical protein
MRLDFLRPLYEGDGGYASLYLDGRQRLGRPAACRRRRVA